MPPTRWGDIDITEYNCLDDYKKLPNSSFKKITLLTAGLVGGQLLLC